MRQEAPGCSVCYDVEMIPRAFASTCSVAVVLAALAPAIVGCKRLKTTTKPCDLVTDDEMSRAVGTKVEAHQGGKSSCDWTFADGGATRSVHMAILTPLEAKIIPQLGKPEAVSGLGDRAEWSGGFAPQLRVFKGDQVLHLMIADTAPKVVLQEGQPHVVKKERNAQGGETTLSTTEETMDFPEIRMKSIFVAKIALGRM